MLYQHGMMHSRRSRPHDFDSTGAGINVPMEKQILKYLNDHYTSPSDAFESIKIAKGVGKRTKKDINKFLYSLQKKGYIVKVKDSPPTWRLLKDEMNANVLRQPGSSVGCTNPTTGASGPASHCATTTTNLTPMAYNQATPSTYVPMANFFGPKDFASSSRNIPVPTGSIIPERSFADLKCESEVPIPACEQPTPDFVVPRTPEALLGDATSQFYDVSLKDKTSIKEDLERKVFEIINNCNKIVVEEICQKIPEHEINAINEALRSLLAKNSIQKFGSFYSLPHFNGVDEQTTVPKTAFVGDTQMTVPKVIFESGGQDAGRAFALDNYTEDTYDPSCFFSTPSYTPLPTAPPLSSQPLRLPEGKNAISMLNEFAQNKHLRIDFKESMSGPDHMRRFTMTVEIGNQRFLGPNAPTKKEAKLKAAEVALAALYNTRSMEMPGGAEALVYRMSQGSHRQVTIHDRVAAMVMQKYNELSQQLPDMITGRKIVAGFVLSRKLKSGEVTMEVVSIGSGNRCVMGDKLSLQGQTVNDCHAEVIARRGLVRYFYRQLLKKDTESGFILEDGKFALVEGVEFHLFISTAPCGDSAIFAPSDVTTDQPGQEGEDGSHHPLFENKKQGVLRTKIENGEGCIPIEEDTAAPTWDGILRGERLRTMSCSDKIAKWNYLGLQGSLLSHFIKPIYMSTLTLGMLYSHGHLTRAVCCRVQKSMDCMGEELHPPNDYKLHHPAVSGQNQNRETGKMKTREFSLNWSLGDDRPEVLDGTEGKCEPRFGSANPPQICKAELFKEFKKLCDKTGESNLYEEGYYKSKMTSTGYQTAKDLLWYALEKSGFGKWMPKPKEEKDFFIKT